MIHSHIITTTDGVDYAVIEHLVSYAGSSYVVCLATDDELYDLLVVSPSRLATVFGDPGDAQRNCGAFAQIGGGDIAKGFDRVWRIRETIKNRGYGTLVDYLDEVLDLQRSHMPGRPNCDACRKRKRRS